MLDLLIWSLSGVCAVLAFTLWRFGRTREFSSPGVMAWGWGMVWWSWGAAVVALVPDAHSAPAWRWAACWLAFSGSAVAFHRGVCQFRQVEGAWRRTWVPLVFGACLGGLMMWAWSERPWSWLDAHAHAVGAILPTLATLLGCGLLLSVLARWRGAWQHVVSHDALTGVYTRRAFLAQADIELNRALRNQRQVALLALDVDNFKFTNERYGSDGGDEVLRKMADITKTCLRREDIFGRVGGEEWMVLLPDTQPEAALVVAERIRSSVSATRVNLARHDEAIRFTVSIGVASMAQPLNLDGLIQQAEHALQSAKRRGRNRVEASR